MAGVLLGSWFGGEIKKRLDRVNKEGKETKVVRFRKKAPLEDNVSEMRTEGWEQRWESYRQTQTGTLVRRIVYDYGRLLFQEQKVDRFFPVFETVRCWESIQC